MAERKIQELNKILEKIYEFDKLKDKDRLDLVGSLRFTIIALHREINGWIQWISNPEVSNKFDQEELEEMKKILTNFSKSFIKHEIKTSKKVVKKKVVHCGRIGYSGAPKRFAGR